ncbi:MAG TPA: DUF6152 family protein [Gammaproteobacteria bacterium]
MSNHFRAKTLGVAAAAAIAAAALVPAHAHHSFAMYDVTKTVTLTGRLTRFVPGANHAQLLFELVDEKGETILGEDGKPVVWGVETAPAARIARQGVTVKAFPVGTIISVTLNPLRDGRNFGALANGARIVKCGMEMPEGGCTPETGEVFLEGEDAS